MNKRPLVSISCITYNHELFIREAIDSFLMQETNFDFEIVIGDDCSSDKTPEILQDYASRYPTIIRLLECEKNLGSEVNFLRTIEACHGKYIALCEGDDFWISPQKLQLQVDFLNTNASYSLCATDYETLIDTEIANTAHRKSVALEQHYTYDIITKDNIFNPYKLKTLTVVFRKESVDPKLYVEKKCGDIFLFSNLLRNSNGIFIHLKTAAYRIHHGGMYSQKSPIEQAYIEYYRNKAMFVYYKSTGYKSVNNLYLYSLTKLIGILKEKHSKTIQEYCFLVILSLKKYFSFNHV